MTGVVAVAVGRPQLPSSKPPMSTMLLQSLDAWSSRLVSSDCHMNCLANHVLVAVQGASASVPTAPSTAGSLHTDSNRSPPVRPQDATDSVTADSSQPPGIHLGRETQADLVGGMTALAGLVCATLSAAAALLLQRSSTRLRRDQGPHSVPVPWQRFEMADLTALQGAGTQRSDSSERLPI